MKQLITRGAAVAALLSLLALGVSACGGGGSSSSSSSAATTTTAAASAEPSGQGETLVAEPPLTEPTSIMAGLEPLKEPPPKGISAINLQCDFPVCETQSKPMVEAAKSLGWDMKTIVFKTGSPQSAMTQAVNTPGVEFVFISGVSRSQVQPQVKAAKESGVKIMAFADPEAPEPPAWPISPARYDGSKPATMMARWMINDSEGKANVLQINDTESEIITQEVPAMEKVFSEECPECSFEALDVTGEELATGTVPAKVVAYLQGHPETNYVNAAFGNLLTGIPPAIKSAGMAENVKVTSLNGMESPEAAMLKKGEVAAFLVSGSGEFSLMALDGAIRILQGIELPHSIYEHSPQYFMCFPETAEQCANWNGPKNQIEEFEKVWGVK